ncbi:tRNA (uracil-5-)-methyltransferase homolog A-like [Halichondria panicea]|uniref:tRNA (uracil-5-)-methyltransferase homolog A-like n=1 Tax=Halichondria panicea TaxID=6063 RepID=UPI00312B4E8D
MLPSRPCATWLCKSEAMLRNCRLLLRFWTSALSKEEWRQLKDITGSRLTPWRGCQTRLITTMDTVSEEQQSVIQHTDTLPSVAGGVEESCDPKSKSCDGVASTSGIQDNTHARRYATEEGYEYLQRGHSTEIFKIIISNVPPKIGYSALKSNLKALNPAKIKKPPTATTCFVNFRSEEERQVALKALNGAVWKKRTISAKVAAPMMDPLYRKRKERSDDPESLAKRARLAAMTLEERLAEVVTPLLATPYQEQLSSKEDKVRNFLRSIARDLCARKAQPDKWIVEHVEKNDGLLCRLEPIRSSPIQSGYRNKCEFTVGMDTETSRPVVGFRLSSYEAGDFTVVTAQSCIHIPQRMKDIASLFEQYFVTSDLKPFDSRNDSGHWRQVAVRCYTSGESMVVVTFHPQSLSPEEMAAEKKKLIEYFSGSEGEKVTPLSLYVQELGRREVNWKPTYEHLLGPKHVHEDLLGLRFRISPDAFFQVNSPGAEVLYSRVGELCASNTSHPIVYDICCGTGTIGLYLAKSLSAQKVLGVEMIEQAVEDARVNAQTNGVANTEFICGKAEDVMPNMAHPLGSEVIGVVDPPRAGLHAKVVDTIRKCASLKRLVYVSCHMEGARRNLVNLCRRASNQFKGLPFRPVSATPIDLFPHTPHCEVVWLLERISRDDLKSRNQEVMSLEKDGIKSENQEVTSPKTDGMKSENQEVTSPETDDMKSENQEVTSPETDGMKSENQEVTSPETDGMKSENQEVTSPETDGMKSENQEVTSPETDGMKSGNQVVKSSTETVSTDVTELETLS